MLFVSRYTQGCELVAMFDDVTDSGNVTFVCDDGSQMDAHKCSRELTSPARGVHTPVRWFLHHIAPPRYPYILKMPAYLAAPFLVTWVGDSPLLFISQTRW